MTDPRFTMDADAIRRALDDGMITQEEAEKQMSGLTSLDDQIQTRYDGFSPVVLNVSSSDYQLIIPVNPDKPDGKKDYSQIEFFNYLLDLGIVCRVHDNVRRRNWLRFDGRVYSPVDEAYIKGIIQATADITDSAGRVIFTLVKYEKTKIGNLIEYLAVKLMDRLNTMETADDGHADERKPYLTQDGTTNNVFLNGVLHGDLRTGGMRALLPFTPYMPFTHCLHARYRPLDYQCPTAEKWFARMLPDEDTRRFVYEMIGYILYHRDMAELPALFILFGPGGTGKSTVTKMIARILGPDNYSKLGLTDLANEFTRSSQLAGKMLNICEEASDQSRRDIGLDVGLLKKLSDGDEVAFNNKGVEAYTAANTAKLLFTTNVRPDFGSDDGIVRRLYRVPFMVKIKIPKRDYHVLMSEDGCTWLAMKQLDAYGHLLDSVKESALDIISFHVSREMLIQRSEQILTTYEAAHLNHLIGTLDYDKVRAFLTTDPEYMSRKALYENFVRYCASKGIPSAHVPTLRKYLPDLDHAYDLGKTKKRINGSRNPMWVFSLTNESLPVGALEDDDDEDRDLYRREHGYISSDILHNSVTVSSGSPLPATGQRHCPWPLLI